MIVYTKDDTVKLSGALTRNQWPTIKAAAHVLMKEHPEGILIDGGELTEVTPEGARTFLDALKDIEASGARIIVCNLPQGAMEVLKKVPGLRSQLALSMSVDQARESLRAESVCSVGLPEGAIVVPALESVDMETALRLAYVMNRDLGKPVGLLGFVCVPRELPLSAPMPEEEGRVQKLIMSGAELARRHGFRCYAMVQRVRDIRDGLLHALSEARSFRVVLALRVEEAEQEDYLDLADLLLRKAPCGVLIARMSSGAVKG